MEQEKLSREEIINTYKKDVEKLLPFLPWLKTKAGGQAASIYNNEDMEGHTIGFPVYDSQLLQFVKEAQKTKMLNRNYAYIYTRYGLHNVEDERCAIGRATLKDMPVLTGILSMYVLKGMTKGNVWKEGVENGILLEVLLKMKELMEFWDKPLA